jgi:integrase
MAAPFNAGAAPPLADAIPLGDFFARLFAPQRLTGRSSRSSGIYVEAIDWLARLVERRPTLADLSADQLEAVQQLLAAQGYGVDRVRTIKVHLSALAKHAWRIGLLPNWRPQSLIRRGSRSRQKQLPPVGSLAAVYVDQVEPSLRAESQSRGKRRYQGPRRFEGVAAAVAAFDAYLGRHAALDDLNEENLRRFRDYLMDRGRAESTFFAYQRHLRRVGRIVDPQQFASRCARVEILPAPPAGSVREFFENVYRVERLIGAALTTQEEFRYTLRLLYKHFGRDLLLAELTDSLHADFLIGLRERGMRNVTVNGHRVRLNAIWRLAFERHAVATYPRIRKLREVIDAPDAWSEEELARIIAATALVKWIRPLDGFDAGDVWRAILLTCYWTALRRGTLRKLRPVDVDLEGGWLNVPGSTMKNGRGKRYKLGADAIAALRAIWNPHRKFLFPCPRSMNYFHGNFRRILRASGVAPRTRLVATQLHKLRRTCATMIAARAGLNKASEMLGHSNSEVTKRYIDPTKMPGHNATQILPSLTPLSADEQSSPPAIALLEGPSIDRKPTELPAVAANWSDPEACLAEARQLFDEARFHLAAIAARIALERWIQELGRTHRLSCKSVGEYVVALGSKQVFDADQKRRLATLNKTANRAAHGASIEPTAVAELVEGLAAFMAPLLPRD